MNSGSVDDAMAVVVERSQGTRTSRADSSPTQTHKHALRPTLGCSGPSDDLALISSFTKRRSLHVTVARASSQQ